VKKVAQLMQDSDSEENEEESKKKKGFTFDNLENL